MQYEKEWLARVTPNRPLNVSCRLSDVRCIGAPTTGHSVADLCDGFLTSPPQRFRLS